MKKHRSLAPERKRSFAAQVFTLLVLATTSSSSLFCLTPVEELQQLAKLSAEELREPENQKKIVQATKRITARQSSDVGRKDAAKAHAEAPKIAAELKEVAEEMRATVSGVITKGCTQ